MLLEDYIRRLDDNSPDYPDVKASLDKVALAANKANDNITKLVSLVYCYRAVASRNTPILILNFLV